MNTDNKVKEYIETQTDKVDEVLELIDAEKIEFTKQNELTANSKKYLNSLIDGLSTGSNTDNKVKEEFTLKVGALGTYNQGDKVPLDVIGKENIEKYKELGIIE